LNATVEYSERTEFFKKGFEGLPYNTLFSQHRRYRALITLEDRTIVPSIMKRISDAGQNLVPYREELRLGVIREKARAINTLKILSHLNEDIAKRTSSNMLVLLKYRAVGDGRLQ
jgi:hypothetical protein